MRYRIMTTSPAGHVFVSEQMYDTRKSAKDEIARLKKDPGWAACEFRVVSA